MPVVNPSSMPLSCAGMPRSPHNMPPLSSVRTHTGHMLCVNTGTAMSSGEVSPKYDAS
eukprot:COSAG02_NODE_40184_length_408_cov_0.925566_1_plen_57_part_01